MRECEVRGVWKIFMKFKQFLLLLLLLSSASVVNAQQNGIQIGSFTLFPTVGLSFGYDDNIFYASDSSSKLSSSYYLFSPGLRLITEGDKFDFIAQYNYDTTIVNANKRFNYEMHHLLASLGYTVSRRSKFQISAESFFGQDRIGTGNQQGNLLNLELDPDEWHSFGMVGKWHYGGVGAKGAVDLELGFINRTYDNNRFYTASRDRDADYYGITYSHNVSPKTNLLAQYKHTKINYDIATLDSTEERYMFGVEWQATGKTNARALIGYLTKNFDEPTRDDFNGLALEAGLTWTPRSYSVFDLTLSRETDETNGNGSYIVRNSSDLGWTHFWKDRFSTTANLGFSNEDYQGSFRDDRIRFYGLSAKYQVSSHVIAGLGFRHTSRNSSFDTFGYTDNSYLLTIEIAK